MYNIRIIIRLLNQKTILIPNIELSMKPNLHITLKHLLISNQKMIGIQFNANKIIRTVIKGLPESVWSEDFGMY